MKRREFVVGVTSITGLFAIGQVRAQVPCPPILMGSSNQPADCPAGVPEPPPDGNGFPDGPLKTAALSLDYGESAVVNIAPDTVFENNDIVWNGQCHYDPINHLVHVMGKQAGSQGGSGSWSHRYYDIRNDTWVTVGYFLPWSASGHVYDNMTIDPATGDIFIAYRDHTVRWYKAAERSWSSSWDPFPTGGSFQQMNGVTWHPHLYGANDGALCVNSLLGLVSVWRRSTQTVDEVATGTSTGNNASCAVYHEKANLCIIGGKEGSNHFTIAPNAVTPGGTPTVTDVGAPPQSTHTDPNKHPYGLMVPHPQKGTVLLVDREPAGKVWETDDGNSWTAKPNFTGAPDGAWQICSIPELGVVLFTGLNSSGNHVAKVWRPES